MISSLLGYACRQRIKVWAGPLSLGLALGGCYVGVTDLTGTITQAVGSSPPLGRGYDRAHEAVAADCLMFRPSAGVPGANGIESSFVVTLIENRAQLRSALHADATAAFAVSRAEVSLVDSIELSASRMHLLIAASAKAPPTLALDLSLVPAARAAWDTSVERFKRLCGDGFVASVSMGVAYGALFSVETADEEDRDHLSSLLSSQTASAALESRFASTFDSVSLGRKVEVLSVQRGGAGSDQTGCETVACAIARAKNVSALLAAGASAVDDVHVQTYPILSSLGDESGEVVHARRLETLAALDRAGDEARDVRDVLEDAQSNPAFFLTTSLGDVEGRLARVRARVEDVEAAKRACLEVSSRPCEAVPAISLPTAPVAKRESPCRRLALACRAQDLSSASAALVEACIAERGRPINLRTCQ